MAFYRKTALTKAYMFGDPDMPQEFINAICFDGDAMDGGVWSNKPHIHTLEGAHFIRVTDWIAKGVAGEFWPIKDNVFQASYELVDPTLPPTGESSGEKESARTGSHAG